MIQSVNFPISKQFIEAYESWDNLRRQIGALGLDGIEAIADPVDLDPAFPPELVSGYHITFYADWLDFWRQDKPKLLAKFGSMETAERFYQARTPDDLLRQFRDDLQFGLRFHPPYMVFHVTDVSLEENWTYRWLHSDYEVMDASIELINLLLRDVEPTFDFLVENLWWPGFTFTDPEKTEYLLSRIRYPRVGIMLDTGHLMNANTSIRTQADGVRWVLENLEKHGALSERVLGLHLHQSVSGAYVRAHTGAVPENFGGDYYRDFFECYSHVQRIDRHRPWTNPECARIVDAVQPRYLTHELSPSRHETLLRDVRRQINTIQKGMGRLNG